jgi:hypothetical protein
MTSVRVHFSPGFPLGGGFPAKQFAPAWWQETAGGEERWFLRNSAAFWRRVFRRELLHRYSEFRIEGNFPESKQPGFALAVFKIHRAPQETVFLLRHYSIHTEHHVGVLLCGKSSS